MWAGMNNDITKPMFFSLNTVRKKGTICTLLVQKCTFLKRYHPSDSFRTFFSDSEENGIFSCVCFFMQC